MIYEGARGGLQIVTASGKWGKPLLGTPPDTTEFTSPKKAKATVQCIRIAEGKWSGGAKRAAPPFHARPCAGATKKGLDGRMWESRRIAGDKPIWRWLLVKSGAGKKKKKQVTWANQQSRPVGSPPQFEFRTGGSADGLVYGHNGKSIPVFRGPRGALFVYSAGGKKRKPAKGGILYHTPGQGFLGAGDHIHTRNPDWSVRWQARQ